MIRKLVLSLIAAGAVATPLLIATPVRADHERRERHERHEVRRVVWQYHGGFFKDAGNGHWIEENASGT